MIVARVGSATGGMAVRSPRIASKRLFVLIPTTNGAVQSKNRELLISGPLVALSGNYLARP